MLSDLLPTRVRLAHRSWHEAKQLALRSGDQLPEPLKPPMPDQPHRSPGSSSASPQKFGARSDQESAESSKSMSARVVQ